MVDYRLDINIGNGIVPMSNRLRDLPSIGKVLEHPEIIGLINIYSLNTVTPSQWSNTLLN